MSTLVSRDAMRMRSFAAYRYYQLGLTSPRFHRSQDVMAHPPTLVHDDRLHILFQRHVQKARANLQSNNPTDSTYGSLACREEAWEQMKGVMA